jgi:hypothetical protein
MTYVNHSGGCPGADMAWEIAGRDFGVHTIAYSFHNHKQHGEHPYVMNSNELAEGYTNVLRAARTIRRPVEHQMPYVKNLLSRNWFQVKHAEAIFAVGKLQSASLVDGGTGWAVQMAIDEKKPVYVFDQRDYQCWVEFDYTAKHFKEMTTLPILTTHFAGIGTRDINDVGLLAIQEIYEHTFKGTV